MSTIILTIFNLTAYRLQIPDDGNNTKEAEIKQEFMEFAHSSLLCMFLEVFNQLGFYTFPNLIIVGD